jgi:hypothetical protein
MMQRDEYTKRTFMKIIRSKKKKKNTPLFGYLAV